MKPELIKHELMNHPVFIFNGQVEILHQGNKNGERELKEINNHTFISCCFPDLLNSLEQARNKQQEREFIQRTLIFRFVGVISVTG